MPLDLICTGRTDNDFWLTTDVFPESLKTWRLQANKTVISDIPDEEDNMCLLEIYRIIISLHFILFH